MTTRMTNTDRIREMQIRINEIENELNSRVAKLEAKQLIRDDWSARYPNARTLGEYLDTVNLNDRPDLKAAIAIACT